VGGGGQGKPYYLNPDGCWRAALGPAFLSDSVGPDVQSETRSSGPSSDAVQTLNPDSIVALASEAIRHANKG
jgi:hypothetical protein